VVQDADVRRRAFLRRGADARRDLSEFDAIVIIDLLLWNVNEECGGMMACQTKTENGRSQFERSSLAEEGTTHTAVQEADVS
jgi:hypothetical protein